jgi:hypothetical protein
VKEFHESKGIFVLNIKKSVKMLEDNGSITNIQYEEKFTPIGKWCGQIGEIVSSFIIKTFFFLNYIIITKNIIYIIIILYI